jgi:UDP-N-acetyl-D-mannosaminuronate dehydrogenase
VIGFDAAAAAADLLGLPALRRRVVSLGALLAPEPPGGRVAATGDLHHLAACDAILVRMAAALALAPALRARQLVAVDCTSAPGWTADLARPLLRGSRLSIGRDVFVALSSARVDLAPPRRTLRPVVHGVTPACARVANAFHAALLEPARTRRVSA